MTSADFTDWKTEARLTFDRWLETQPDQLPETDLPESLHGDEASGGDLLSIVGELTALKQEVRGLGRSSARLAAAAGQSTESLVTTLRDVADDLRALGRDAVQRARIDAERPLLLEFGDVREALRELVERATAARQQRRWRWHRKPDPRAATPLTPDALHVLARRIDGILERHGVEAVGAADEVFDGRCMTAVGISRERHVAPGRVSAVVRTGFRVDAVLLRSAEVIVESEETLS